MEGVETAFSAAQALLERTNLQQLCKAGQKIVLLEHNQTIADALKSLSKAQILSGPMVRGKGCRGSRLRVCAAQQSGGRLRPGPLHGSHEGSTAVRGSLLTCTLILRLRRVLEMPLCAIVHHLAARTFCARATRQ